jgi:hypothetical protein
MVNPPEVVFLLVGGLIIGGGSWLHGADLARREKRRAPMTPEQRARDEEFDRVPGDW